MIHFILKPLPTPLLSNLLACVSQRAALDPVQ